MLLLMSTIIIISYSANHLIKNGFSDTIVPINTKHMMSTLGFSIYTYEMPGIVMPCMKACSVPEKFD